MAYASSSQLRRDSYDPSQISPERFTRRPQYKSSHNPVPQPPLVLPLTVFIDWLFTLPPISTWPSHMIDHFILAPISVLLQVTRDFILSPRTHRVVVQLGVLGAIFWTALAAAIVNYIGFYRAWVPEVGLRKEVWLQYGLTEPPFCDLRFDDSELDARLSNSGSDFFAEDQVYDVTLELGVPLNEANLDLGNFMVSLDLKSASDRTIYRASRPTLLTYSAAPVRALSSFSQLISRNPPSTSVPSDSQLLRVPLLRRVVLRPSVYAPTLSTTPADPKTSRKVTQGRVTVGRNDAERYWMYGGSGGGYKPPNVDSNKKGTWSRGELQTYAASLRFDAHLTGLRFFMYHYPLLSFFLFTSLFLALELATALTLWTIAAIYTSNMTLQSVSLETEEHYVKAESGEEALDEETDTKKEAEYTRRFKSEEEADAELQRLGSLESLRARDAAERAEAIRAARLRDMVESRRMTGMDTENYPVEGMPRRVLGPLDEETEEETEVGGSVSGESSIGGLQPKEEWEDLDDTSPIKEEAQSTIGGSVTSGPSSIRSFGATSLGPSISTLQSRRSRGSDEP